LGVKSMGFRLFEVGVQVGGWLELLYALLKEARGVCELPGLLFGVWWACEDVYA
jgi:hypothetical protein